MEPTFTSAISSLESTFGFAVAASLDTECWALAAAKRGRCVTVSIKISKLAIGLGRCGGMVTTVPPTAVDTLDQASKEHDHDN